MNQLYKLVRKLSPTGVHFCSLEDVCRIETGKQINKGNLLSEGNYPVLNGGISPSGYWHEYNTDANTIAISQGGASAGYVNYITTPFWEGAHCYVVFLKTEKVLYKFLYYFIKNNQEKLMNSKQGAGIPGLNRKAIYSLNIPLPPLPIQQEIVRILDTFTNLTAELTAELTARRKQYEYYRDELLRFKNRKDIQWVPFGDYFEFKNGLNKGKEYFGSGNYIVNFTDVYKNRWLEKSMLKGRVQVEDKEVVAYSAQKGDVFFTRTSETREEIGMVSALVDDIDGCVFSGFVLRARPLSQNWLPKFCAYFFSTSFVRKEIIRYASFTTRALTSGPRLSKIKLPLLPIQEQEKIVDILDNFSSLCNGVEKGLPAEISARQKQYEYYRDQLLTFKRIGG